MTEEKLEELKLDLIDIVNPIGEVLEEFEAKFEEFKQNTFKAQDGLSG